MDLVLFEDNLKYDTWLKFVLVFSVLVPLALGILFYVDAYSQDVLPDESEAESKAASLILFASTVFVLLVNKAVLPRTAYVLQDKIRIKYGVFFWNIPFATIRSARTAKGIPLGNMAGSVTSLENQVEIVRENRRNVRISPTKRDLFLEHLNRALDNWKKTRSL